MNDIYYKGYRLYIEKSTNAIFDITYLYKAKVLGRNSARFVGYGVTEEQAINNLKIEIDKFRK